jgi:hypothetical protein
VDGSHVERNDASRARLRQLVARLGEGELSRELGDGWTVAAGLAHLAWWDRYALASLESWQRSGAPPRTGEAREVNAAALADWLALPPSAAAAAALDAAEALDRRVAALPGELAEEVVAAGRPRLLDRSLHRNEHLDQIERALGGT